MDDIHWYPGHMARGMRFIKENIKNVDVILTLTDARAPISTLNQELCHIAHNKPLVIVLNKSDLVDKKQLSLFIDHFKNENTYVLPFSTKRPQLKSVLKLLDTVSIRKKKTHLELKIMVTGISNVGKSSFINLLTRKAKLKVGKKAGLTRGIQWVKIDGKYAFLDTPGIVMKKMNSHEHGIILACTGAINDNILDMEQIAEYFFEHFLTESQQRHVCEQFKIESLTLENIAQKRGFLNSNQQFDRAKAATAFIKSFREGKLGKFIIDEIAS